MKSHIIVLATLLALPTAGAQQSAKLDSLRKLLQGHENGRGDTVIVMTVPLKYLSANDAVALLTPYATSGPFQGQPGGGVFPVPGGGAITIRERVPQYGRMLSILKEYDHPARVVEYNYQLIMADNSGRRAVEIASLDSVLRSSLKYTGFRLLGSGSLRSGTMGEDQSSVWIEDYKYSLLFDFKDGGILSTSASTRFAFAATRQSLANNGTLAVGNPDNLMQMNTITVPIGQTVVVGKHEIDKNHAIIIAIRPELVTQGMKRKED